MSSPCPRTVGGRRIRPSTARQWQSAVDCRASRSSRTSSLGSPTLLPFLHLPRASPAYPSPVVRWALRLDCGIHGRGNELQGHQVMRVIDRSDGARDPRRRERRNGGVHDACHDTWIFGRGGELQATGSSPFRRQLRRRRQGRGTEAQVPRWIPPFSRRRISYSLRYASLPSSVISSSSSASAPCASWGSVIPASFSVVVLCFGAVGFLFGRAAFVSRLGGLHSFTILIAD